MLDWFKRMAVSKDQQAEALTEAKVERLVGRFAPHPSTPALDSPARAPVEAGALSPVKEVLPFEMPEYPASAETADPKIAEEWHPSANENPAVSEEPAVAEPRELAVEPPQPAARAPEWAAETSDPPPDMPDPVVLTEIAPALDAEPAAAEIEAPPVSEDRPTPTVLAEARVPPAATDARPAAPVYGDTRIIVVASQKGGSGKTTLAAHLAVRAGQAGHGPAVLIDTDPQGSLTEWWHARGDASLALETVKLSDLDSHLAALRRQGAALIIIDTPPALTTSIEQVIGVADLVLVPARPSPHDLRAIGATVEMIRRAAKQFLFVVNGAAPRANITAEAVAALSEHGQVAPVILYQRTDYAASMIDGRTVMEASPSSRSTQEITDLWNYVRPRVNLRAAA